MKNWKFALTIAVVLTCLGLAHAQFGRRHTVIKAGKLELIPSTAKPPETSAVAIEVRGQWRTIRSNGIPTHETGSFPNRGNPNRIRAQRYEYQLPAKPKAADQISPLRGVFGVAVNGVPFDPGAAEFYMGRMGSKWQYEPLSGAIALGIDMSHAHVQPTGAYHYHGLPTGLLDEVQLAAEKHSPLIGWAGDGFPIYALYGYSDAEDPESGIVALESSYRLREGRRPGGNEPGGSYDGTFVADYEYVEGSGQLDECNGRYTATPEFPDGTYAYFLTENWPVIPRAFRGTPASDFRRGPGGPPPGGPGFGPPPRGRGFGGPGRRGS